MENKSHNISKNIAIAMFLGLVFGIMIRIIPSIGHVYHSGLNSILDLIGAVFIKLLKMILVPVVFVSLINGITNLQNSMKLGRICTLSVTLYLIITIIAITIAISVATFLNIGVGANLGATLAVSVPEPPTFFKVVLSIFPENIIAALAKGDMLQVLFLATFIGSAILYVGKSGDKAIRFFAELNSIVVGMVWMIMRFAPIGIFCLLLAMVSKIGMDVIIYIIDYILTVALVLVIQLLVTYNIMLRLFTNIKIKMFLTSMRAAMLFAFSVSSSSAAIPVVMEAAKDKLKLSQPVVSFVVPLGAAINMDGTAIMQGIATVFIANAYGMDLSTSNYLTIVVMATVSSVGTAGMPGIGIITLAMVLSQVGLPAEGISMIIGIDILVDMMRTAINVCGGCVVACIVDRFCIENKSSGLR